MLTRGIKHWSSSGYSSVLPRIKFGVTGQESSPQSPTFHTATVSTHPKRQHNRQKNRTMNYTLIKITFKENCDVWYEIAQNNYDLEIFSHIVDYPINKIELDDIDSIYPIYKSEMKDGKTLIEIKGSPTEINLKYVKKEFLKKKIINDNKISMKYCENIQIYVAENQDGFWLQIHSSHSYISAIRKLSTAKFNNYSYAPGDLSSIILKESGTMQIEWYLEIMEDRKKANKEEVQKEAKHIYQLDRYYDSHRQYRWLDEINEQKISKKSLIKSDILFHTRIEDILNGSCFYLSAGADITPIIAFQDKIQTFIFCDEYGIFPDSNYSIEELWLKIDNKLEKHSFNKIETINIDKNFLKIKDIRYYNGESDKLEKVSMSLWVKNKKLYCLIYLNWDNSMAFHRLYVENRIIPKAICEILPDGGTLGKHSRIKIPYKFRMPEYSIGHNYSLGKPEEYELILNNIEYYGEYGPEYGSNYGKNLYKRK